MARLTNFLYISRYSARQNERRAGDDEEDGRGEWRVYICFAI